MPSPEPPETYPPLASWRCFGCGGANEHGLHLRFHDGPDGTVRTRFVLADHLVGVAGVAHGGILATVFDDLLVWTCARVVGAMHVTLELHQRFHRPTPTGAPLVAEGRVDERHDDGQVAASARLWREGEPERLLAAGWGTFRAVPGKVRDQLPAEQVREFDAVVAAIRGG